MLKKLLLGFLALSALAVGGFFTAIELRHDRKFDGPYPEIAASTDPGVIERGRYIVFAAAHCGTCHGDGAQSQRAFAGEELPLSGGYVIDMPLGRFTVPNITPDEETGIGKFTDGELARALRYGVARDGRALFPFMPFQHLSDDDLTAVISYLRAQAPVKKQLPLREFSLLGKAISSFLLEPEAPSREVRRSIVPEPTPEYGKYLALDVANCYGCHTERDMRTGAFIGPPFGGGNRFPSEKDPSKRIATANLTKHATGMLARYEEDAFVARMHAGTTHDWTPMPWGAIDKMTDDDLRAIYRYLETVEPVDNDVGPVVTDAE